MKKTIASALVASCFATFGLVGCTDESKVTSKETVADPGGKTTTTIEKKVDSTGNNPPSNSAGETGKSPK